MAALFIDPSRLVQGGLLGVSSSEGHTYAGTYRRTDSSQPIQVHVIPSFFATAYAKCLEC